MCQRLHVLIVQRGPTAKAPSLLSLETRQPTVPFSMHIATRFFRQGYITASLVDLGLIRLIHMIIFRQDNLVSLPRQFTTNPSNYLNPSAETTPNRVHCTHCDDPADSTANSLSLCWPSQQAPFTLNLGGPPNDLEFCLESTHKQG